MENNMKKILMISLFMLVLLCSIAQQEVHATSTVEMSSNFSVGIDWGEPVNIVSEEELIYNSTWGNETTLLGKTVVTQYTYFAESTTGQHLYLIVTETNIIPNEDFLENATVSGLKIEDLTVRFDYNKYDFELIDYLRDTTVGNTTISMGVDWGLGTDGLELGLSVSNSRDVNDITYLTTNSLYYGYLRTISSYNGSKLTTLSFVDAIVLHDKNSSTEKIEYDSEFIVEFEFYAGYYEPIRQTSSVTLNLNVEEDITAQNKIMHDEYGEFDYLDISGQGDWIPYYSSDMKTIPSEYGAFFHYKYNIYSYDFKGEIYYLIILETQMQSTPEEKCRMDELRVKMTFDYGTELLRWSPSSEIGSSYHGFSFGAKGSIGPEGNKFGIGGSVENAYEVSDIDTYDHSDTKLDDLELHYIYDNGDMDEGTARQFTAALVKETSVWYDIDVDIRMEATFSDWYGLFNAFNRHETIIETVHKDVQVDETSIKADMVLTDDVEHYENVSLEAFEYRRIVVNSIYSGTMRIETSQWNSAIDSTNNPYIEIYDKYGNYLGYDDNSGVGYNALYEFEVTANSTYFIKLRNYCGSCGGTNYNIKVSYPDLQVPDYWNTVGTFSQNYYHDSGEPQPIIVSSQYGSIIDAETSNNPYYSGYTDTYMYIFDMYGNEIDHDDDGGYSLYSLIEGVYIEPKTKVLILIRGYSPNHTDLEYNLTIQD